MISVSEQAREHIRRLLADAGTAQGSLRLSATEDEDGDLTCEMQVSDQPEPSDIVVEIQGVRLLLTSQVADALDKAELTVEDGELALAVPEAAST